MKSSRDIKVDGIILKKMIYRDTSLILELITQKFGKISVLAKGVRTSKNKAAGLFEPGNETEFLLYKKPDSEMFLYKNGNLQKANLFDISSPKVLLFFAALEIYHQMIISQEDSENFYQLLKTYFKYIKEVKSNEIVIFWRFILRIMKFSGIELNLTDCILCKKKVTDFVAFYPMKNGFICQSCYRDFMDIYILKIAAATSDIFHKLPTIGNSIEKLSISIQTAKEINIVLLQHLTEHFHKRFHSHSIDYYLQDKSFTKDNFSKDKTEN